jgi:hypothetical protein
MRVKAPPHRCSGGRIQNAKLEIQNGEGRGNSKCKMGTGGRVDLLTCPQSVKRGETGVTGSIELCQVKLTVSASSIRFGGY